MNFLVDTQKGFYFNEDSLSWIQAIKFGKYHHPSFGDLDFNPETVNTFVVFFYISSYLSQIMVCILLHKCFSR